MPFQVGDFLIAQGGMYMYRVLEVHSYVEEGHANMYYDYRVARVYDDGSEESLPGRHAMSMYRQCAAPGTSCKQSCKHITYPNCVCAVHP